jgi:lipoprotein-anchoring transpeptidase ErfK/SrfK
VGLWDVRVAVVRVRVSVAAIALSLAGLLFASVAASAQTYYPQPDDYPPPGAYPPPPGAPGTYPPPPYARPPGYVAAPLPPAGVGQRPTQPYGEEAYAPNDDWYQSEPYGAPRGYLVPRPPGDVGAGAPDSTGTTRSPWTGRDGALAGLPPDEQPEGGPAVELAPQLRRQLVRYVTPEPAGTIIIDTPHTYLYLVLGDGTALRYGVGVGREGFTWTGTERISRMSEWPDWHPPKEMIERQPYLPRFMAGGEGNPLGARALYLGNTEYRIHGTNQPSTIGHFVSSGCIRLTNEDVADLYSRVGIGTRVVVLPGSPPASAATPSPVAR